MDVVTEASELGDAIIVEVAGIHMHRIALHHVHVAEGFEDLSILIKIGAVAGHRSIAVLEDYAPLEALYSWLEGGIVGEQVRMIQDDTCPWLCPRLRLCLRRSYRPTCVATIGGT